MDFDSLWRLGGFLLVAGAVYGGIRADLKEIHERIGRNERAIDRLHVRVDDCAMCKGRGNGRE